MLVSTFTLSKLKAQTPTNCLEIESVLVDACGTPEGENEMVRFKIGPSAINISNLNVNWPNNSFLGISPVNATTNAIVTALNATILSCGYLVQPIGGVLPAGKSVLLISSTNVSLSANSFANLSDTLYVIFQNAGNTAGHFVNYSSTPGLRTLTISRIAPACSDAVTYDKSLLINQTGGYGGSSAINDGATVEFSWPGVATYINNGCEAPIAVITADAGTATSTCASGTIVLNGSATGNYTNVIWQGGAGVFSSPNSLTTNYTAGATESGSITLTLGAIGHCADTVFSSVTISITPLPNPVITPSGSTSLCPGDAVTLTGSGGSSYLWSTGATSSSISVSAAGSYTLTATNSCGSQTTTQLVTVSSTPSVTINTTTTSFCSGATAILYAIGGTSFIWNDGSSNDSLIVNTGGTYSVTSSSSCGTATNSITITELALPTAVVSASGATALCPGSTVTITGSGGTSYLWLPSGATGNTFTTAAAGTYTLTATNACGSDTTALTISSLTAPSATISTLGSTICAGSSTTLIASGGDTYLWSNGQTGSTTNANTEGTYWVVASNACGSDSSSVFIHVDSVTASFSPSTLSGVYPLPVNFTNNSSPNAIDFIWDFGDNSSSTQYSPNINYTEPGNYTVTLTASNSNGCTDSYSVLLTVLELPSLLQIPNVFSPNGDDLNDEFYATGMGIKEFNCKIYDRWGILMSELVTIDSSWDARTTSGSEATDGTYFYLIKAMGVDGKEYNLTGFIQLIRK